MSNLAEQLVTLRRCAEAGRLGSVSGYPQLASLLEAKILTSFERSLGYLHKARLRIKSMLQRVLVLCCGCFFFCSETLADICKHLKSQWKEAERLFADIVGV